MSTCQYIRGLEKDFVLGEKRIGLAAAEQKPLNLTLVLLEQADRIVFRVSLEIDRAHLVRAYGKVHAAFGTFHQHMQAGLPELRGADVIETRMRHVELRIDIVDQRGRVPDHPVREYAPALGGQRPALLVVLELQRRVRGEADVSRRGEMRLIDSCGMVGAANGVLRDGRGRMWG